MPGFHEDEKSLERSQHHDHLSKLKFQVSSFLVQLAVPAPAYQKTKGGPSNRTLSNGAFGPPQERQAQLLHLRLSLLPRVKN